MPNQVWVDMPEQVWVEIHDEAGELIVRLRSQINGGTVSTEYPGFAPGPRGRATQICVCPSGEVTRFDRRAGGPGDRAAYDGQQLGLALFVQSGYSCSPAAARAVSPTRLA